MDVLKAVGKKIRVIRKGQGFSQEDLGEKTGLSANYIGLVERGQKQVTLVTLAKIAASLGVDLSVLFEGHSTRGKKSPTEIEILDLLDLIRTMKFEDIKAFKRMAKHFTKRLYSRKK